MSSPTRLTRRANPQPGAVPWLCLILSVALLGAGCGGGTTASANNAAPNNPAPNHPAPSVSVSSPVSGATVSGTITVTIRASANTARVQFYVDGASAGPAVTTAPFSFSLNTATLPNGSHLLTAVSTAAGGQTATSAGVSVRVNNAASAPPPPPPPHRRPRHQHLHRHRHRRHHHRRPRHPGRDPALH